MAGRPRGMIWMVVVMAKQAAHAIGKGYWCGFFWRGRDGDPVASSVYRQLGAAGHTAFLWARTFAHALAGPTKQWPLPL